MRTERLETVRVSNGRGITLSVDAWGHLVLVTPDGRKHSGVEPVRAFPISDPTHWIAFCDVDGREVLCLESIEGLTLETRQVLEQELALREFVPAIKRIIRVSGEGTPSDWEVETDRGPTRFTLDNEDDVRRLGPHRVLITDMRKLRFQVPDTRTLDFHSRRILERYL
jgi:uncharacterized protein DUF1854